MRPCVLALIVSVFCCFGGRAGDLRNFDDAALHAIQFVDENEGWAVGDDGVVWHSIDGGQNWERQSTGIRASLRSVQFLTPFIGWIAGREELPQGRGSAGVLLYTRDGGLKWQRVGANVFPGLNRVRFIDAVTGFVVGDGTDQYPSGVFRTTDAGRTWKPMPGPRYLSWLAADFQDAETGALVGAWSRLTVLRQGNFGKADMEDTLGGRAIQDIQVMGQRAVAVGQGGLVLLSRDSAGGRWGYAEHKLSPELRAAWDFRGVHCVGEKIWAVGRPGSVLLHSSDYGQSWQVLKTEQPLPLNGVFFVNGNRGWAVGELGSILGTADGGKSWRVQHRGGQRAAVLFVHARPSGLPVDTVAQLGGEEGYLAAGLRVLAPDPSSSSPERASEGQRFEAAMRAVGGAAGEMLWQFPMPQHAARADKGELLQAWNPLHGDRAAEELLRQLVLTIRTWRPSVIITDHPDSRVTGWPSEALLTEALHEAFTRAADPKAFPEQLQQLGLEPWEVAKVYGRWDSHDGAQVTLDLTRVCPLFESTLGDFAEPAMRFLAEAPFSLPAARYYHLLDTRIAGALNHRNLMQGVELTPAGVARRSQTGVAALSAEAEKAIRERRNLQALAESRAGEFSDPNRILTLIGPMTAKLPEDHAAQAVFAIANQYVRMGQWSLAREVFLVLVDRYPAHPLAAEAYRWLIRHNTSSEVRRRHEMGQFWVQARTSIQKKDIATSPEKSGIPSRDATTHDLTSAVQDSQLTLLSNSEETRRWYQGSLDLGKRLTAFGPLHATEASTQFCLQAARRHLGDFDKAQQWYGQFRSEHADGPWRDAAAAELWLLNRSGMPPKQVVFCRPTATRPFLDGELNDTCWQGVQPLVMRNAAGDTLKEYPTEVRLSYDRDFLYLALRCQHPGARYVAPVKVRPHDADLRPYDRVSLLLDLDRDYSTFFRLEVDQRGCVCDDCWGDRTWNPRWFVAVRSEKDCWQIEAAIPMSELTGDTVTPGKTWACNIVRTLPGRGVQAWSLPVENAPPRPEPGMGLLMFMQEPGATAALDRSPRLMPKVP